jgi:GAF domain-containing protein
MPEHNKSEEFAPVPAGVAEALGAVARSLQTESDVYDTLTGIVRAAVDMIPGAEDAGVALVEHGAIRTIAQTSDRIRLADEAQYRVREGPCVDAVWEHRVFRIDDLDQETRWPRFAEAMAGLRVRSMVSFRLFVAGDTLGVLNMFSSVPNAFDADSENIGELIATHAAVALAGSRTEAQLEDALTTRDLIGTAKGIVASGHGVTTDQAFQLLIKTSQNTNVRLADVARSVVTAADQAAINSRGGAA